MIAVVDSGATKADWLISNGDLSFAFTTKGYSPYFYDEPTIYQELKAFFNENPLLDSVSKLYFYGSGCSTVEKCSVVQSALNQLFSNAIVFVNHDLDGAAIALCGNQKGVACILGTGSNSCVWDGQKVIDNVVSLGYILGDFGSANHIGKSLLQAYFWKNMPADLFQSFEETFQINKDEILHKIYKEPNANTYIANFSIFLELHPQHPFLLKLIEEAFFIFFKTQIAQYPDYQNFPIGFVGSIAFYYQDILNKIAEEFGCKLGKIIQKPIESLMEFHANDLIGS